MAVLPIESVKKICQDGGKQVGGVKSVRFTDMQNLILGANPLEIADIYTINFRKFTGRYSDTTKDSRSGQYDEQFCSFYIPRFRFSVEVIRKKLKDRPIGVIVTDWLNNTYVMNDATLFINFDTGTTLGDDNGYNVEIISKKQGVGNFNVNILPGLMLNEGQGGGGSVDFGGGAGTIPDGSSNPIEDCCVLINQTTIPTAPAATGNVFNKNRIVTTDDGEKFFIDKNGNSILLNDNKSNVKYEKIIGDGSSVYTPSVIDLTTIDVPQAQLIVERFGSLMQYTATHNPADPDGAKKWSVDDTDLTLSTVFPLESWEYIQLLKIA